MFPIIFYWFYCTVIFFTLGYSVEKFLQSLTKVRIPIHFFRSIVVGIASLLILLSAFHFFYPINGYVHLFIIGMILSLIVIFRVGLLKTIQKQLNTIYSQSPLAILMQCCVVLFFAYMATDMPFYNLDEGRYHFQAMLWTQHFKIIPGLANLHDRFGSNSSWYLLNSLFDVSVFNKKVFHVINPLMMLYLILYVLFEVSSFKKDYRNYSVLLMVLCLYYICNFSFFRFWYLNGITPDMGVFFFSNVFLIQFLWTIVNLRSILFPYNLTILSLIALSALLSRSSGILLAASSFILLIVMLKRLNVRYLILNIVLFVLVVLIFLTRNFILSGHPLFPSNALSIINVDWRFPDKYLNAFANYVPNYELDGFIGKRDQYTGLLDFKRLANLCKMLYTLNIKSWGAFSFSLLSIVLALIVLGINFKRATQINLFTFFFALFLFICNIILTGECFRFGSGYVICAGILALFAVVDIINPQFKMNVSGFRFQSGVQIFIVLLFSGFILIPNTPISIKSEKLNYLPRFCNEMVSNFWSLKPLIETPTIPIVKNDLPFFITFYQKMPPARLLCWYSPVDTTCSIDKFEIKYGGWQTCEEYNAIVVKMNWMNSFPSVGALYEGVELRGRNYEDGFKFKNEVINSVRY